MQCCKNSFVLNRLKLEIWLAGWRFSMNTINLSKPFDDFSYDLGIKISVDFLEEIVQSFMIHQTTTHFPSSASCPWALMTLNI